MSLLLHTSTAGEVGSTATAAGFVPGAIMTAQADIWLAAQGMLAAQGENAVRECQTVIESRRKQGDQTGVERWTLILACVQELQQESE